MSFAASFYSVPEIHLAARPDDVTEIVRDHGRELPIEYYWGGLCVQALLEYLDEARNLQIEMLGCMDGLAYVLPYAWRSRTAALDPATFATDDLVAAMGSDDFGLGLDDEEAREAAVDTLDAMVSALNHVEPDHALVIVVA
jgi:hypothetical protein